jgi:anthranilate synthase component 2
MRIAMIDNYDSFTYNLVQYLGELGAQVDVVRNDALDAESLLARGPDGVVISPGPGDPDDAGISLDAVHACARTRTPLLGVCLGHQSIGQAFGGRIVRAMPMHGKLSEIRHGGTGVFRGIDGPLKATRYHSLVVERGSMPKSLAVNAETDDGLVMGLAHDSLPTHGVQFHPESIASEHGHLMLKNFLDIAHAWNAKAGRQPAAPMHAAE